GDLIVAAGFGGGPRVAGYSGPSISTTNRVKVFGDFFAFEQGLRNGVFVAVGDVNGDGRADLIAGGGPGGGPRVTAFSGSSLTLNNQNVVANFFAGDDSNRGGVRLAARDLNSDNRPELITGAGVTAGSKVNVYAGTEIAGPAPAARSSFDAFPGFSGGVFVG
ncbi:MAG: hypothetical protein ACRCZF_10410, partial [Gemmataceae bacterium]